MTVEEFIKKLRRKREFRNISQSKLALKMGVRKSYISRMELHKDGGSYEPKLSRLIEYAEAVGYSVNFELKRNG